MADDAEKPAEAPLSGVDAGTQPEPAVQASNPPIGEETQAQRDELAELARLLVQQMREFPVGNHDDGPDSLELNLRLGNQLSERKYGRK